MNITEKDLKLEIEISLLYEKLQEKVTSDVKVSDDQTQKYYNEN
jgi:hypothetical protein